MKKYFSSRLVIAITPLCLALMPYNKVLAQSKTEDAKMNAYVKGLMSKMTLDEKIGQLNLVTIGAATTGSVVNKGVEENIKNGSIGGVFGVWGTAQTRQIQDIAVKN
ncbi:hypothetical protein ACFJIV_20650 [Mucilaginibacter sp. UC70_90]